MISIIAKNTFKEATRTKSFISLIVLFLLGAILAPIVGWVSSTSGEEVNTDIIMSGLSIIGVLVAIATGTALVYTEIQNKTLYTVLSRPLSRWHFIIGKYVGLASALIFGQIIMLTIALIAISLTGVNEIGYLLIAGLLIMLEVCLMAAVSLMLTTVSSPLLAAVFSLIIYALGHAVSVVPSLMHHLSSVQSTIAIAFASLIPNLEYFTFREDATYGIPPSSHELIAVPYGLLWILLLVCITGFVFKRKQL